MENKKKMAFNVVFLILYSPVQFMESSTGKILERLRGY